MQAYIFHEKSACILIEWIPMVEHEIIIHYFINHSEVVISETQEIGWTNSDCWSGTFNLS